MSMACRMVFIRPLLSVAQGDLLCTPDAQNIFQCFVPFHVSAAQPCGGRLNSKDAGYITSPGYPNDYPSHQNCEWVIYTPESNQKIILNFNPHFEIEKHDCK